MGKPWENHGETMGQWWFFMGFMGFFWILWDLPNLVVTARLLLEMAIEIVEFPIRMVMFHSYVTNYQRLPLCIQVPS